MYCLRLYQKFSLKKFHHDVLSPGLLTGRYITLLAQGGISNSRFTPDWHFAVDFSCPATTCSTNKCIQ